MPPEYLYCGTEQNSEPRPEPGTLIPISVECFFVFSLPTQDIRIKNPKSFCTFSLSSIGRAVVELESMIKKEKYHGELFQLNFTSVATSIWNRSTTHRL